MRACVRTLLLLNWLAGGWEFKFLVGAGDMYAVDGGLSNDGGGWGRAGWGGGWGLGGGGGGGFLVGGGGRGWLWGGLGGVFWGGGGVRRPFLGVGGGGGGGLLFSSWGGRVLSDVRRLVLRGLGLSFMDTGGPCSNVWFGGSGVVRLCGWVARAGAAWPGRVWCGLKYILVSFVGGLVGCGGVSVFVPRHLLHGGKHQAHSPRTIPVIIRVRPNSLTPPPPQTLRHPPLYPAPPLACAH